MRYYKIVIKDSKGKLITTVSSVPGTDSTYISFANGRSLPGALQVEFDVPIKAYGTPMKGALVRVWGVSLEEIAQAAQLNPTRSSANTLVYNTVTLYAGMAPGLPLATAAAKAGQTGQITFGAIYQALGNWIGTDQTLDLILSPAFGTNATPQNLVLNWPANTALEPALRKMLADAFPESKDKIVIKISPKLKLNHGEFGVYYTLEQVAGVIKQITASILGGEYPGVDIYYNNGTFNVYDGTVTPEPKQILFQDLIGQPTWIGGEGEGVSMQFKCVMRADIALGDTIKMPKALVTTTAAAPSSLVNLKSAFDGNFRVNEIRHVGNFRQPDGESWVTTFNAAPYKQMATAAATDAKTEPTIDTSIDINA